jgi:hypothetical protein
VEHPQLTATFFRVSTPRAIGAVARLARDAVGRFRQAAQDGGCCSIKNSVRVFQSHGETSSVTSVPHWQ